MSMAVELSSTIHKSDSMMSSLPTSQQPLLIAKSMNFNLPIKLNRDNYIYWKALVMPAIRAIELEDIITGEQLCPSKLKFYLLMNDLVVVLVSHQSSITFHEAQYMLMIHEQMIEHLNSSTQVDVAPSANFAANNSTGNNAKYNNRRGHLNGGGRNYNNRGKRGKGRWNNTNRLTCQIYSRVSHTATQCYNR
ncbi:hypothetical protein ACOSP7_013248 [Xanthoceras sorbifolium]